MHNERCGCAVTSLIPYHHHSLESIQNYKSSIALSQSPGENRETSRFVHHAISSYLQLPRRTVFLICHESPVPRCTYLTFGLNTISWRHRILLLFGMVDRGSELISYCTAQEQWESLPWFVSESSQSIL